MITYYIKLICQYRDAVAYKSARAWLGTAGTFNQESPISKDGCMRAC